MICSHLVLDCVVILHSLSCFAPFISWHRRLYITTCVAYFIPASFFPFLHLKDVLFERTKLFSPIFSLLFLCQILYLYFIRHFPIHIR
ncbi:hypothetical protein BO86DRAFT_201799 [Aspergillus japonicus CBS 114.51]|uniref:Uncharacterized protein n=1 Tax=Aspergillus japonicus CBS 114.51 TaxID=1448312 RepID=A0A8T8WQ00_ASPJA|nr:hypothetical protein BO86DRAFT_201799 [Aspergillus japonicus CBS 114.51]RAH77917.1 hypothetical protein BO86DRAFT_201799 [Aspergillus japonicus CBS 114.51]